MENQRQTNNTAYVVGVLKKKDLKFTTNKNNQLMAIGSLVLVVDNEKGKGEVKIKVMQSAEKKDGTPNNLFKSIQTIENEYKSIETHGEELADTIKVEGSLEDGTYYSIGKGEFVESLDIKGTFFRRVEKETPHCCKIVFEGYVSKITPSKEELEVELIGIGFRGDAIKVDSTIPKDLVLPFNNQYSVGCTATLNMSIVNHVTTTEVQSQVAFGQGIGEAITKVDIRREVFGGEPPKYAGTEGALSEDDIKKALAIREANHAKKKDDTIKRSSNSAEPNMNVGFGAGAGTAPQAPTGFGSFPTGGAGGFGSFPTGQ